MGRGGREHLPLAQHNLLEISLSLLSPFVWFPLFGASTRGWGFLHHTHAVALLESGSESIFFRCSAGSEPGGMSHTPYVCETTRCCTCGNPSSSGGLQHGQEDVRDCTTTPATFVRTFPAFRSSRGMNIESLCCLHQHSIGPWAIGCCARKIIVFCTETLHNCPGHIQVRVQGLKLDCDY